MPGIRAAAGSDLAPVCALVAATMSQQRLAAPLLEIAEQAILHPDDEQRCLIAESRAQLVAAAVFGMVGGTEGAGRLHLLVGKVQRASDEEDAGALLVNAALESLRARGARLVVAELPVVPGLGTMQALLRRAGFEEEALVPDYFGEGVGMAVLVWR
jgi:ribosomal protein S18 acetylase RimI-like enzyme